MKKTDVLARAEGISSLLRPFFSPGLLLEDEDLNASVAYTRNMVRLLFRSLFGCGVICGLKVTAEPVCENRKISIEVEKGVALDCAGNPIEVPKLQTLLYDPGCDKFPEHLWVTVCYTEKPCRPKDVSCSIEEAGGVAHTRNRDGFEIKVYKKWPDCACTCEPKPANDPEDNGECCRSQGQNAPKVAATVSSEQPSDLPAGRECYRNHIEGVCECESGCSCVVIGKIDVLIDNQQPGQTSQQGRDLTPVDCSMRRFIRPVLQGYFDCVGKAERPETGVLKAGEGKTKSSEQGSQSGSSTAAPAG